MLTPMMYAKLHRATVTHADLEYEGSITIDENLLKLAQLKENQQVHIYNVNNGERFETYIIKGKPGSGIIAINGAAAHKANVGDKVIIVAYAHLNEQEIATHKPYIVILKESNEIKELKNIETELTKA